MKKLYIVTKNELLRYFTSPLAYVYLVSFLLLNGSFAFYFGGFFDRGQASLDSMFAFQPWFYLIFVPGIAMRLWAEEFRNKTIIQIVTMPVSISSLVWGKFLSAWIFCGIALVLTFPFWITINILGDPDNNVVMVSYLTSFLTAGCILAISSTMSSLTKNQVIALVLSFFANILFFMSGLEFVLSLIRVIAPASIVDMIASFSFLTHFDTMSRGVIDLRDIIFFSSILMLFNLTTTLIVSFKTSGTSKIFKSNNKNYYILCFFLMLVGFIGLNLFANNAFRNVQYDFTKEKLFTLSDTTKKILKSLPNNVTVKLYYSPILGQRNPELRLMFDRVRILLDRYANLSNGKLNYKIYSPQFLDKAEDEALASGIQPIPIIDLNQSGFFGMSFSDELDNKNSIPFFAIERKDFIEQDITQKIYQLHHQKKTVGILSSIAIGDTSFKKSENMVSPKWEILNQIEELYNIVYIKTEQDIDKVDVLMIVHPQELSDKMVERIKEFSLKGGKLFVALDAATEAARLTDPSFGMFTPSDLKGLDEFWGFKFHSDLVIADLDNSITVDTTQNYQTTPKFTQDIIQPKLQGKSINRNLIETANLKSILLASVSPLTPESDDVYFVPLLQASTNSELMPIGAVYQNIAPEVLLRNFKADDNTKFIAARIISKDKEKPFELVVIGDTDFMYDTFWSESIFMLNNKYVIPILDNANFVINALDVLSNNYDLIALRGKSAEIRKFQDIEKMRIKSQKDFSIKEGEIIEKIELTKAGLQEIWAKRDFEGRDIFTPDELAIIAGTRKELENLRQELSSIRANSNYEVKKIETTLKILNIYTVPALIILGLMLYWLFSNRKRNKQKHKLYLNKEFFVIFGVSLILLSIGIASVYFSEQNEIDRYENKFVFNELRENINKVERLSIKTHYNELVFYKGNDGWVLEGHETFNVYQERIRSFLSALLEATYYEKKSAKAEHLSIFGLQPIEELGSPNTRIEMFDSDGKVVTSFEIGKYDIDIGRGSRAAYIKFDDKFQTWMISVDLIDLSTNWQDWTYSTMWNLRYGRVQNINNISDIDINAELIKNILNIRFSSAEKSIGKAETAGVISITNEDNDVVKINILNVGENYYIKYEFAEKIVNPSLKFFAKNAKKHFYRVDSKDKERMQNVIKLTK